MSVARHLHTPPQPRTEVDVAADAIVAILDARIVSRIPGMIGRLSMATGVPVAMIKKALKLKDSGHGGPGRVQDEHIGIRNGSPSTSD